jgi:hypothetical protein
LRPLLLPLALAALQGTSAEEPTPPVLLDRLVRLTAERDFEAARAAGDALLARDLDDAWRAEVQHARGVSLALAESYEEGADAFRSAAALAGPGALRDGALYGAGTSLLFRAEELFLEIPEVRERRGLPPLPDPGAAPAVPPGAPGPPVPTGAAPADDDAPDPLEVAREAYLAAKDRLLDRLRHDWRDVDTRANLELVQRRLRELDDIEREREEQEPPPPEQQPDPEQGEGDGEGEPQEDPPEQPPEQQPEQGEDPGEEPPEMPPEGEQEAEPPPAPTPEPPAPEELAPLTPEQLERLYDALQEAEQEMRDLRRAMRSASAPRVEKDW